MFDEKDTNQIKSKGIEIDRVMTQIENYKKGFPFLNLFDAATINNSGIKQFDFLNDSENYSNFFNNNLEDKKIVCFVPASGAASRMFKLLFSYKEEFLANNKILNNFSHKFDHAAFNKFINEINKFAFYDELNSTLKENNIDLEEQLRNNIYIEIIEYILFEKGLNYSKLPKGLIKFHKYSDHVRTAFEEHLSETAKYVVNTEKKQVNIHFTISEEHRNIVENFINSIKEKYEKLFGVNYNITFSVQKPSTDVIGVDLNNKPFRNKDGSLLFRPGGHGALIENLNEIDSDIITIKNIDNVVPDSLKNTIFQYKKMLVGLLLSLQSKIFELLEKINTQLNAEEIENIKRTISDEFQITFSDNFKNFSTEKQIEIIKNRLNRPIRVCGMVKNEGEPGGGPFWIKNSDETITLQIVESSQINMEDPIQKNKFFDSTHFNPVDIVCGVKDYNGNKFDLTKYIDNNTGFISLKSKDGIDLKAQELPGLWNGAMSDWISIFVEVPIITFNPVKTINDLLRDEHQS